MNLVHIGHLGAGGFGAVDRVRESSTNLEFARKTFIPPPGLSGQMQDNVRKRFIREVRTQSGIRHRNIVPIVYAEPGAAPPFYLMPIANSSLQDDLNNDRSLGGNWLQAIVDIVAALDEMHGMGIYHRDLKPQNVLRYSSGDTAHQPYYAVSDFGLIAMEESRVSSLTMTGMIKNTDYYTAPEITSDLRRASPQSDIYSLGCILHEMIGTKPRVPCQDIREDGPYSQILLNCTRSDPARRFRSVRDVLDAIIVANAGDAKTTVTVNLPFTEQLYSGGNIDESGWKELIEYVEDHENTYESSSILSRVSLIQVKQLWEQFPMLGDRFGLAYANWVRETALRFDHCDYVANVVEQILQCADYGTKVECLMALLRMGTSHNRWYVERKFYSLCGPGMDEGLAKRLAVEFRAAGPAVCRMIDHLEHSISATRDAMHPNPVQTLHEVCR